MIQIIKKYINISYYSIICIFLSFYIILISILSAPNNPLLLDYSKAIKNYTKAFARQGYFVFTPVPTNHYHIFLTYHAKGLPDLNLDFYKKLIYKHHTYPLSSEKTLALHHDLAIATVKKLKETKDIKNTIEYGRLINLIHFYKPAKYTHGSLVIKKFPTTPFSNRKNNNYQPKEDVVIEIQHIEL